MTPEITLRTSENKMFNISHSQATGSTLADGETSNQSHSKPDHSAISSSPSVKTASSKDSSGIKSTTSNLKGNTSPSSINTKEKVKVRASNVEETNINNAETLNDKNSNHSNIKDPYHTSARETNQQPSKSAVNNGRLLQSVPDSKAIEVKTTKANSAKNRSPTNHGTADHSLQLRELPSGGKGVSQVEVRQLPRLVQKSDCEVRYTKDKMTAEPLSRSISNASHKTGWLYCFFIIIVALKVNF